MMSDMKIYENNIQIFKLIKKIMTLNINNCKKIKKILREYI